MKPFQLLLLAFVLTISFGQINLSYSQSIYFCEGVDDDLEPINASSHFTIPEDGGYLYVLVQLPNQINCESVYFDIYRNGMIDNFSVSMNTNYDWDSFYTTISFKESGEYGLELFDCNDNYIASGSVKIDKE